MPALVAGYAGTTQGAQTLPAALRALRAALPGTELWLLWPAGVPAPRGIDTCVERRLDYPAAGTDDGGADARARRQIEKIIDTLRDGPCTAALIFAERAESPYTPAYLCYLAGIERRAGFSGEFGGAVLSDTWPQPHVPDSARHRALLEAVGIERPARASKRNARARLPESARSVRCAR